VPDATRRASSAIDVAHDAFLVDPDVDPVRVVLARVEAIRFDDTDLVDRVTRELLWQLLSEEFPESVRDLEIVRDWHFVRPFQVTKSSASARTKSDRRNGSMFQGCT
jgi:hypothetical protein